MSTSVDYSTVEAASEMSTSVDVIDLQSVGFIEAVSEISTSVDLSVG